MRIFHNRRKYRHLISILIILVIGICITILVHNIYISNTYYKRLDKDKIEQIDSIIKENQGKFVNLNTYQCMIEWIPEAREAQIIMMDKILKSIKIEGEAKIKKPNRYIRAQYPNMRIFIPYNYDEQSPKTKMFLEIDNYFYIVSAREKDVNILINYMNDTLSFKPATK